MARFDAKDIDELRRDRALLAEVTLSKHRAERKAMHVMLTDVGIPEDVAGDGVRSCLMARIALALARLQSANQQGG